MNQALLLNAMSYCTPVCAQGVNCNNGDAILRMMTSWNTKCDKLQCFSRVLHKCLMQRWKNCVANERDFVVKYSQLWKVCTHDICKFHYNCNDIFWEKEIGDMTFLLTFVPVTWAKALYIPLLKCHASFSLSLSLSHTHTHTHTKSNVLKYQLGLGLIDCNWVPDLTFPMHLGLKRWVLCAP